MTFSSAFSSKGRLKVWRTKPNPRSRNPDGCAALRVEMCCPGDRDPARRCRPRMYSQWLEARYTVAAAMRMVRSAWRSRAQFRKTAHTLSIAPARPDAIEPDGPQCDGRRVPPSGAVTLALYTPGGYALDVVSDVVCPGPGPLQPFNHNSPIYFSLRRKTDMCGTTETRTQLPLTSTAEHGCSCCSPAAETQAAAPAAAVPEVQASGAQYTLEGLTCGHCVQTVENAVSRVSGVQSAAVDLVPGGTSQLKVIGTADHEALAKAVHSSGYILTGTK